MESLDRTVRIPCRIEKGAVKLLYGGPLPDIEDGAVGELILPAFAILDAAKKGLLLTAASRRVLPKGARLLCAVPNTKSLSEHVIWLDKQESSSVPGPYVEIILESDLILRGEGTKKPRFERCACRVPALELILPTLNQAYTAISREFESHRASVGGNVYRSIVFLTDPTPKHRTWTELDVLRSGLEADLERNFQPLRAAAP